MTSYECIGGPMDGERLDFDGPLAEIEMRGWHYAPTTTAEGAPALRWERVTGP